MKRRRKIWALSFVGISLYLVVNGAVGLVMGVLGKQALEGARTGERELTQGSVSGLDTSLALVPWTSLGAYRLPYLRHLYDTGVSAVDVGQSLMAIWPQAEAIAQRLGNSEQQQPDWQVLDRDIDEMSRAAQDLQRQLKQRQLHQIAAITGQTERLVRFQKLVDELNDWTRVGQVARAQLPKLLGYEGARHYVILLQNNMELRPTGGYLGSYADITIDTGVFTRFEIEDIGWPNGQIKGYVKEPDPIRRYLFRGETPGWRLRDSNWQADYPEAAKDIVWFFNEGGVENIDSLVAVNMWPVRWWLEAVEPLPLVDYQVEVKADTFYQLAQTQAEQHFFPGSTQKGDFLGAVGKQMFWRLQSQPDTWIPLGQAVSRGLQEKQILISELREETVADMWDELQFSGRLWPVACEGAEGCQADYLHLNEANLGINKTNCCIKRQLTDRVEVNDDTISHQLTIEYENTNPPTPDPPRAWGGGYHNYLRIFVPRKAAHITVMIDEQALDPSQIDLVLNEDKLSIGFLVGVPGQGQATVTVGYRIAVERGTGTGRYELLEQKQSGIEFWPVRRTVNGQNESFTLWSDRRQSYDW